MNPNIPILTNVNRAERREQTGELRLSSFRAEVHAGCSRETIAMTGGVSDVEVRRIFPHAKYGVRDGRTGGKPLCRAGFQPARAHIPQLAAGALILSQDVESLRQLSLCLVSAIENRFKPLQEGFRAREQRLHLRLTVLH